MRNLTLRLVFAVLVLSFCLPAQAARVEGLYQAEADVASRQAKDRKAGLARAMLAVLTKVTGNRNIAGNELVKAELSKADRYLQQYRYRQEVGAQGEELGWRLWARFDEVLLNEFLRRSKLPVWGEVRPATLVWLTEERDGSRTALSPDLDNAYVKVLPAVSENRGAPLLAPLLDLDDRQNLPVSDLWGDFEESILRASERYAADAVLTGRISRIGDNYSIAWSFFQGGSAAQWTTRSTKRSKALIMGLQNAMDVVVARFAPLAGEGGEANIRLTVTGIDGIYSYAQVQRYLQDLTPVRDARVVNIDQEKLIFALQIEGGLNSLRQSLNLGGLLQEVEDDVSLAVNSETGSFEQNNALIAQELFYEFSR